MSVAIVESRSCYFDTDDILQRSPEARALPNARAMLDRWFKLSQNVWFGMHDGEIACVWGLAPPSTISNRAYLWLLTTDLVGHHKFLFIRHSQVVIEDALKQYNTVVGHVEVGNEAARKWLRWLGAEIDVPENGYSAFKIRRK